MVHVRPRRTLDTSLTAELRDPAWTLARQLQLGEFLAVDGGSPAFVDIATRTVPAASANQPLEPVLETEPVAPDLALRIELGHALETLIDRQVTSAGLATAAKTALRTKYPLPAATDPAAGALLAACAGKVADGVALQADLAKANAPSFDAATVEAGVHRLSRLGARRCRRDRDHAAAELERAAARLFDCIHDDASRRPVSDARGRAGPLDESRMVCLRLGDGGQHGNTDRTAHAQRSADSCPLSWHA
jgi:hypothetical protein